MRLILVFALIVLAPMLRGQSVVINEIMYHPLQPAFGAEPVGEEFIELFNAGTNAVNMNGWRFSKGFDFTFTNFTLAAGAYVVVSPNLTAFAARYPGVANVVGNGEGMLGNNGETITLKDANNNTVDSVSYGTEGDWAQRQRGADDLGHRGWTWFCPASGGGKSMERRNPQIGTDTGQNWAFSAASGGTPGRVNSSFTTNIAPLILDLAHSPLVPKSTEAIAISARIVDEQISGVSVTLFWRVDSTTPPAFSSIAMFDDGAHGDGAAGDSVYGAIIPAQANNTVIEFYVQAVDSGNRTSTWPRPVIAATDGAGPTGQVANALCQVDDNPQNLFGALSPTHPLYKLIMTENERAELAGIPCSGSQATDAEMNGTWITMDGTGQEFRYNCGYRNRGHGTRCASPPNYRVNIPNDHRWHGVRALNLNSQNTPAQILGATIARRAGLAGADSRAAQVRVNNVNQASTGTGMLGAYAANEEMDSDWANEHFPLDSSGNIYRAIRDVPPDAWVYRGPNVNSYVNTYFKTDNVSAYDWSDLIQLHRIVGTNDLFSTPNVRQVANVDEWMIYYAVMNLFGNNETSPNVGYNDDYFMYRGVNDPRFILLYYDNDTILSSSLFGARAANDGIFTAEANNGMGAMTTRFLEWPDFKPRYYAAFQQLLDTTFSKSEFDSLVDETLGTFPATSQRTAVINGVKSWMDTRRATVQSLINGLVPPATNNPVATISGEPRSPTPFGTATLTVGGTNITAYKFKVNSGAFSAEIPVATPISLSGLANNSTNTVYVIGKNSGGIYQDTTNPTVSKTWVVRTSIPKVRLNEVLARNETAVNHNGTFPDVVELYNEGATTVDLSGLRLTDDPTNPNQFVFPAGTSLAADGYLVLYADNSDGTPGFHLGFALNQGGDAVYLYDSVAAGGALLDSVVFGFQLADKSLGRFNNGEWVLCQPSFGVTNVAQPLGNAANLKINEWQTSGQALSPDDFIELYNPDPLPVAVGGMYLTDEPIGAPALHRVADLSFIAGGGFANFIADGNSSAGANHLGFALSSDVGELALNAANGTPINSISYGPQRTGISEGRCPDGNTNIVALATPTPGAPNLCPVAPPAPITVSFLAYSNVWKYNQTSNYDGVGWMAPSFNDSAWLSGPGVLGVGNTLPEPVRTTLTAGRNTYYFRTTFTVPANANISGLQITHYIDDGAVVYLNGKEEYLYNLGSSPSYATFATLVSGAPPELGPFSIPMSNLVSGVNVLAVEVHQGSATSPDLFMGVKLEGIIATNTASAAGIVINEVLANNDTIAEPDGSTPKWVELYNPSTSAVNLGDMSFTDSTLNPRRWVFPSPTILPAQGYLTIRFDSGAPASATNTGFGLKSTGDAVYLFDKPADGGGVLDFVIFGLQTPDFSIGRYPSGSTNWTLTLPSSRLANALAPLGNIATLKVNEWMADPSSGDDWFEIYNPDPQPVAVGGLWLSDDLASSLTREKSRIPALSFIGALTNAYQRFWADNNTPAGADHVTFSLKATGEAVGISTASGALIDGISFASQEKGISEGRFPDGTTNITRFPATVSPGDSNYKLLTNIVVSEVLSHTDLPLEDAVEFQNISASPVNIGGWYLSDSKSNLRKFTVPANTSITPGGFKVFYEYQFNAGPGVPFSFSSAKGDNVYLSQTGTNGQLTGYRAHLNFDAAENGVSFGRYVTSVGTADYPAMSALSFGTSVTRNDPTNMITVFRTGQGAANPYPKVGPVVFSEIMYHPPDFGTNDNARDEFLELRNITASPVNLFDPAYPTNRWKVRGDVDFDFPSNTTMAANGSLLLVSFDPTNTATLAAFKAAYGITSNITVFGPWSGKLANSSASVRLYRSDTPQLPPASDAGFVPFILVEEVIYSDSSPWATNADGFGQSLQRVSLTGYGNDPTNWVAANPTPTSSPPGGGDTDGDGIPDDWETMHGLIVGVNDAGADPDRDGMTNLQEYLAGTDPQDPNSKLALAISLAPGNAARLQFQANANVSYTLQYRPDAGTGVWQNLQSVPAAPTDRTVVVTNSPGVSLRFYRVTIP